MARLKAADDGSFIKGIPELWTVVLDRMACDESIVGVRAAIHASLQRGSRTYPEQGND